ncbi:SgcJ/EcaC family oxidoreductase [Noviherbaspirillum sp. CPCC 100848]|uniref:SgcJ/EcaC family oxidoreductase n=1 Tax=Noviherbaspirillum album TaxID=3080276 RepID=A0ABU6J6J4_9BURK|nr:SgcJ/EcaC family oxidoreductase [Noviherbaspirillum sp. CPCC 100848]MEC4719145.1 SgcJ/EcaC family oxidoreductase [Noviherbaspirillum sp. CPCC 100848]
MPTDEQSIRDLFSEWQSASEDGDADRLARLISDDVVFLTPGQPPMRGKESFLAAFHEGMQHYRIESEGEIRELHVHGRIAYCWSQLSVTVTPRRNGLPMRRSGPILTVLRKEADNAWVIVRDANMLTPQPAAA